MPLGEQLTHEIFSQCMVYLAITVVKMPKFEQTGSTLSVLPLNNNTDLLCFKVTFKESQISDFDLL